MSERVIEGQIQYYRRRAAEYDATAYGAPGPAAERIGSFFGMLRQSLTAAGEVIFVDEHVSRAAHEQLTADPELVTRDLSDGTRHQVVKVFLDPPQLAARPGALGWDCELEVDGEDWVIGWARPRE